VGMLLSAHRDRSSQWLDWSFSGFNTLHWSLALHVRDYKEGSRSNAACSIKRNKIGEIIAA